MGQFRACFAGKTIRLPGKTTRITFQRLKGHPQGMPLQFWNQHLTFVRWTSWVPGFLPDACIIEQPYYIIDPANHHSAVSQAASQYGCWQAVLVCGAYGVEHFA